MGELKERVWLIDEIRGIAILLMVIYHLFFDLVMLFHIDIPAFTSPAMDVIRDFFAGLFIFISGTACRFSSNNLKRGVQCFALGMLMTFVTAIALPKEPILFGILHLLGVCMILFAFIGKWFDRLTLWGGIALCVVLFCLTCGMQNGFFGVPGLFEIPHLSVLTDSGLFFPFGIPGSGFISLDYFPLFPWIFVFFAGAAFGIPVANGKMPQFFYQMHIRPLAFVGRYTIWIYLLHQPVLMGICLLVFSLIR